MPVEITGFSETPNVGDELVEMENERAAKSLGKNARRNCASSAWPNPARHAWKNCSP